MSRAVQPRFGQFAFGKCTLDILHQRGAFFTVIACGYRVLTWDLFPNQSAYKKTSSKQHARNSIWVLIWLLFQFQPASILVFECGLGPNHIESWTEAIHWHKRAEVDSVSSSIMIQLDSTSNCFPHTEPDGQVLHQRLLRKTPRAVRGAEWVSATPSPKVED